MQPGRTPCYVIASNGNLSDAEDAAYDQLWQIRAVMEDSPNGGRHKSEIMRSVCGLQCKGDPVNVTLANTQNKFNEQQDNLMALSSTNM